MPVGGWWPGGRCGLGFAVEALEQRGRFRFGQRVSVLLAKGEGGIKTRNGVASVGKKRWCGKEWAALGWNGSDEVQVWLVLMQEPNGKSGGAAVDRGWCKSKRQHGCGCAQPPHHVTTATFHLAPT